jgi:hypothetical protein
MAKDKFDKAFEDMKSGKIQGPTNDDMSPRQKETLTTKDDIARNEMAAEKKDKYLKSYGTGLKDSLSDYKRRGDLGIAMGRTVSPEGQGYEEMRDAIRSERKKSGMPAVEDNMKKGGTIKAKKMASGGKVSQLAKANGCAVRGKTRGKIC